MGHILTIYKYSLPNRFMKSILRFGFNLGLPASA